MKGKIAYTIYCKKKEAVKPKLNFLLLRRFVTGSDYPGTNL